MKTLEVIKPGTKVKITCPDAKSIPAIVDSVGIGYLGVTYRLVWWSGNDRKENSFVRGEFEVDYSQDNLKKIGFINAVDS